MRKVLGITIIVAIVFLSSVIFASLAKAADWPMYRHDLAHSGAVGHLSLVPTQTWTYTTDAIEVTSSPAVVDGVVYVGSLDYNVYAIVYKAPFPTIPVLVAVALGIAIIVIAIAVRRKRSTQS
jgi:hypothetical protein